MWEKQTGDFEQGRGMGFQVSLLSLSLKLRTSLYLIIITIIIMKKERNVSFSAVVAFFFGCIMRLLGS